MFTEDKVTEIFFMADEFCKFFYCLLENIQLRTLPVLGSGTITAPLHFALQR